MKLNRKQNQVKELKKYFRSEKHYFYKTYLKVTVNEKKLIALHLERKQRTST